MIDEPNVILPLAHSYNERGVQGYTHAVTNSEDQRKVNCMYEPVKNAMTGKGTLTLSKRPGVTVDAGTYGTSPQTSYLINDSYHLGIVSHAVFNKLGNDSQVSVSGVADEVILSSAVYYPAFVDLTALTNVQNVVVQLRRNDGILTVQRLYFNTALGVSTSVAWTEITDPEAIGFFHVGKAEHLDGYMFIMSDVNIIWNSDLNSVANWTITSFIAKQIRQDFAIGLARLKNQLLAFGRETVEVFYNAGGTTGSPLGRLAHLHNKIGLVDTAVNGGTHYYCTVGGRLYFVGRRAGGQESIGVFTFNGSEFEKVSTPYIDKILSEKTASIYSVNAVGHHGQIGVAICLTAPGASPQQSLIFYPDWKEWFEWNSTVFSPVNDRGFHLGVASQNKLYTFDATDNWQDAGTSYPLSTQFRLPSNGGNRNFMIMYGVDADTDTSANDLTVEFSDNDCASFYTVGTIDQTRDRKMLFRGGSFRKRHVRLGNTNARPTRIHNFLARIEK